MNKSALILTIASIGTTISLFSLTGLADPKENNARAVIGPDVVAWAIGGQNSEDIDYDGSSGGFGGYSMATVSCNWGDAVLDWYGGTNNSPIIMQNMFRLKDGIFEQIGMQSFMKHSFCALSESGCGSCQATNCDTLGIGCADTYWAGLNLNGDAPRSDINAFTGEYPYPFTHSPSGPSETRGNLVVANVDVDPALNAGARYFIEAMYIAADDHAAGNGDNNASYREIGFNSISDPYVLANGPQETIAGDPAIRAWAAIDPNVSITETHAPGDGLILLASKVTDNGDGTFDYDYAIHNLNCDRSIGSIEIPTGSAAISNVGFKDINYNSGEIYDSTDWSSAVLSGSVNWNTVTYAENPNGNALRWGTMYNYSFTASASPVVGDIQLGLFKPGGPDYFSMATNIPTGTPPSLIVNYPNGQPALFNPNGGTTVDITISSAASDPVSGSAMLHWSANGTAGDELLTPLGNDTYQAVFPSFDCEATVNWYISVQSTDGNTIVSPGNAPKSTWSGIALSGYEVNYEDDFELDLGWSVSGDATDGQWDRGVPVGGGDRCDPATDGDGSGSCYLTDNTDDNSDVDGGTTILTSPSMDASSSPTLNYSRWYSNGSDCGGGDPMNDSMEVEFSIDDGATWMNLETIGPGGSEVSGGWFNKEFDLTTVTGFVPNNQFQIRFLVSDLNTGSVIEAGVDGLLLSGGYCDTAGCSSDLSGDGVVNVTDLLSLIAVWGPCPGACDADFDNSGTVDVTDLLTLISDWGACE